MVYVDLGILAAAVAQLAAAAHPELVVEQLAVVVGDPADAPAPVLRCVARILGQAGKAARDFPVAVVEVVLRQVAQVVDRSEEHTSELQSLMRISYAVFCLKKKNHT